MDVIFVLFCSKVTPCLKITDEKVIYNSIYLQVPHYQLLHLYWTICV